VSTVERVLIDTSAWVAFFRGSVPGRSEVRALVTENRAVRCGPVELELRRGLRRSEAAAVLGVWSAVPPLAVEAIDFTSAGDLLRDLRENGTTMPSIDGLIAALALRYEVPLLSLDHHFAMVPGLRMWPTAGS
jgi:predicted nucleic acid-binding protein